MKVRHPSNNDYFINPQYFPAVSTRHLQIANPVTQEILANIVLCRQAEIQQAISAAAMAHQEWSRVPAESRAEQLQALACTLEKATEHNLEIARLLSNETGQSLSQAMDELALCPQIFQYYADLIRAPAEITLEVSSKFYRQQIRHEPYGISVHILSARNTILTLCQSVAAALATGNSCIIKPAKSTTLCSLRFVKCFNTLLSGLVCCIPGDELTAQLLVQSPNTQIVFFSGAVAAGNAVAVTCAELMKPCILETEGGEAAIISKHSSLPTAAIYTIDTAFRLGEPGKRAVKKIYVVQDIYDQFIELCLHHLEELYLASSKDINSTTPLLTDSEHSKLLRLVCDASLKGATLLRGKQASNKKQADCFYEPTLITNVTTEMTIFHENCPGPVAIIIKVRDFNDVLQLTNEHPPTCGISLFSNDACEIAMASEKLDTSRIDINPASEHLSFPGSSRALPLGTTLESQGLNAFRRIKRIITHHIEPSYPSQDDNLRLTR